MGRRTKIKRIEAERIIRNRVDELFCQTNVNERQEIIRFTLLLNQKLWIVALNNVHGHGKTRLLKTIKEVSALYSEFLTKQNDVDTRYAEDILNHRVEEIMGNDFEGI